MGYSRSGVIWSIKEITEILRKRQLSKFDVNIGVSGRRGNGKSTLLFDIFNSFKKQGFKQKKHQVYNRDDVIALLSGQQFGYCWDDEAINSGYKRDFQDKGQKDLIKIITNYRDNFNIYGSALPFFYSLDKDLRELIFLHFHVIERGVAVMLMPLEDQIHGSDPWDTKRNIQIEEQENKRIQMNPDLKFRYARLTTFAGYVYFGDMGKKQRQIYEQIKKDKRAENFKDTLSKDKPLTFMERAYKSLIEHKVTIPELTKWAILEEQKPSSVLTNLNKMLRDAGMNGTVKDFVRKDMVDKNNKPATEIDNLVPDF